jgi:hypothetical protein
MSHRAGGGGRRPSRSGAQERWPSSPKDSAACRSALADNRDGSRRRSVFCSGSPRSSPASRSRVRTVLRASGACSRWSLGPSAPVEAQSTFSSQCRLERRERPAATCAHRHIGVPAARPYKTYVQTAATRTEKRAMPSAPATMARKSRGVSGSPRPPSFTQSSRPQPGLPLGRCVTP